MNPGSDIPEMNVADKYSDKTPIIPKNSEKAVKEMEKTKKELEKLKTFITKKFSYIKAIGMLPPQSIKFFIEEEEVPKETEKHVHLLVIIPDEKIKEKNKISAEIIKKIETLKQKIWLQIKTPSDIWEICLDSKFELSSAIAMSFPLYDKGILGSLRVAEIHKSLVLRKFEKYVVSYVIGGSLVRGQEIKTSDVDVFVIINDTDIKHMPRLELKEKLRNIIYKYVAEASALAGVKNKLSPQIYLLTDFWESVKDANPVIFTFIRDGIPIYDRGTFMPWKSLLRMGKLKPSQESIDMFMSMGDKVVKRVKRSLLDLVVQDIFWSVITPSQALIMLYGLPPPNVKETVKQMKAIFYQKEKMLEKKYIDILEEIAIKYYKGYEHEKIKEVSGKEVDKLLKNTEDYLKRLKELRGQIEKKAQEQVIEQIYGDVFSLLKSILGSKSQIKLVEEFEKKLIKTGKFDPRNLKILKDIVDARAQFKKGKLSKHKVEDARKNASILINSLIEYTQRCDLAYLEKGRMKIKYKENGKDKFANLINCDGESFFFDNVTAKKITDKIQNTTMDEVSKALEGQKKKNTVSIDPKIFELLKKELGEFEIVL